MTNVENIYKCRKTINIKNRLNNLQTGLVTDIKILYSFECKNASLLENKSHKIFNKFRYSNREHFECELKYIVKVIYIIGSLINKLQLTENSNIIQLNDILKSELNDYLNLDIVKTDLINDKCLYI
jgi:hypothetical protein